MKPLHYFLLLSVFIYVGCSDDHEEPQPLVNKEIQFKIYSNKDYTDETYDNHYVKISVAAMIMTYDPYKEEYIMDQSTDWIALKDIPSFDSPIIFEGLAEKVNESKQTVVVGYSYTLKIGEYTESYGKNDFIDKRETQKTIPIIL